MKFDFTSIIDRRGKDSIAVDHFGAPGFGPTKEAAARNEEALRKGEGFDLIPMWVADMNFKTCPAIPEAIIKRAEHPLFGYFPTSDEYYQGIIRWQTERHGVKGLLKEHIGYENGVLGGVATAMGVLCSKGDKVLLHSPTYVGFTGVLNNNGYKIVHTEMKTDEEGVWRMDFEDMEEKIRSQHIHTAILCSPYNPCGRVWERWELEKAMEIFERYQVYVISDEIWSDIILDGHKHIPTQSVSEYARTHTIAFYAPTKTFNLAGLQGSYHIVYDRWLKDRMDKEASLSHYNSLNVFSMHALIGAYSETGEAWVDELCETITKNVRFAADYIRTHFEGVKLFEPEGTYMLYLDCEEWCRAHGRTLDELLQAGYDVYVAWQDGRPFHRPYAIRMNLALPYARVEEAFRRLDRCVFNG